MKNVLILFALLTIEVSCSSKSKVAPEKSVQPVVAAEAVSSPVSNPVAVPITQAISPVQEKIEPVNLEPTHQAMESLSHGTKSSDIELHLVDKGHGHSEGVAAEKSLGWLKNGNTRFVKGRLRADGQSPKDRTRLVSGQKPHAIVLSCSDSRVPAEIVFDQKLGEIFSVRTAGESLDSSAIASIEYAIEHLGSRLIVVLGHTYCGAVNAALDTSVGGDAGSPHLNKLVSDIQPRILSFMGKERAKDIEQESWSNTKGVAKDLMDRSNIISTRVKSGDVKIVSSMYYLDSGKVLFAD
ncbi:MAG TPA: carbonic anhydrase [Pseudobdellovibrionaceae bacterium]|nr:carbonic anhydrase [Pseudobdellovibrionaceae bacterium]